MMQRGRRHWGDSNRFPNFRAYPSNVGYLKFLLSDESAISIFPISSAFRVLFREGAKYVFHIFHLRNVGVFLVSLGVKKLEKLIALKICEGISNEPSPLPIRINTKTLREENDRNITEVPTLKTVAARSASILTSHLIIYPLSTVMVRLANDSLQLDGIFKLFMNPDSFVQLYRGIGYHLLWIGIIQIFESVEEIYAPKLILSGNTHGSVFLTIFLSISRYFFCPLQIKALNDQAYPERENVLCWTEASLRYIVCTLLSIFVK